MDREHPKSTSETSLAAVVDSTSDVHVNEIKKELSLPEPYSHEVFVQQTAVKQETTSNQWVDLQTKLEAPETVTNFKLKVEEAHSESALPAIFASTSDDLHLKEIKKEFSPFELTTETGSMEHILVKHEDTAIQCVDLQIKSEIPDMKFGITSGNDDIYIKLEPVVSEELHIKNEIGPNRADQTREESNQVEHFYCDLCNCKFTCKGSLQRHLNICAKAEPFQCNMCDYQCKEIKKEFSPFELNTETGLMEHILGMNHEDSAIQCVDLQKESEVPDMKFGITSGNDDIYIKLEPVVSEELHIKNEIDQNRADQTLEKSNQVEHFYCDLCNCKFTSKGSLQRHLNISPKAEPFQCNMCDYQCIRKCLLKQHESRHIREKPFKCTVCSYTYVQKSSLQKHMRTHTGKTLKCHVCDYQCVQKGHLHRHMKTHTGDKPFKCSICDYRCIEKSTLQLHMKTHTVEKPFQCTICNYRCTQKSYIQEHIKTHTSEKRFKCNVCDYRCFRRPNLQQHMKTHTGEKPFVCNICDYKAARKNTLQLHMKIHTREKPFKCGLCDYRCIRKSQLPPHMKTHI